MAAKSVAQRSKEYRERRSAKIERTQEADKLILHLYGAVYTAENSSRIPAGIHVPTNEQETARNLIEWLKGQQKLFTVEKTARRASKKRGV